MVDPAILRSGSQTSVSLQGPFGKPIKATLVEVQAVVSDIHEEGERMPVALCCAVTNELVGDSALITVSDMQILDDAHLFVNLPVQPEAKPAWLYNQPDKTFECPSIKVSQVTVADNADDDNLLPGLTPPLPSAETTRHEVSLKFKAAQKEDLSLATCWEAISDPSSPYFRRPDNELLYHTKVIAGVDTPRLVLPESKRAAALALTYPSHR